MREGASLAITALPREAVDSTETRRVIEAEGRRCAVSEGDLTDAAFCRSASERTVSECGHRDIMVSNAAYQNRKEKPEDVSDEEFDRTFKTNVYSADRYRRRVWVIDARCITRRCVSESPQ